MTLFIQRSEYWDTQAIHAKLDGRNHLGALDDSGATDEHAKINDQGACLSGNVFNNREIVLSTLNINLSKRRILNRLFI